MHQRTEAMTFDEAFDEEGTPRPHYADLIAALEDCDLDDLSDRVTDQLHHSGVTFGEGAPFRLAPPPRGPLRGGGAMPARPRPAARGRSRVGRAGGGARTAAAGARRVRRRRL